MVDKDLNWDICSRTTWHVFFIETFKHNRRINTKENFEFCVDKSSNFCDFSMRINSLVFSSKNENSGWFVAAKKWNFLFRQDFYLCARCFEESLCLFTGDLFNLARNLFFRIENLNKFVLIKITNHKFKTCWFERTKILGKCCSSGVDMRDSLKNIRKSIVKKRKFEFSVQKNGDHRQLGYFRFLFNESRRFEIEKNKSSKTRHLFDLKSSKKCFFAENEEKLQIDCERMSSKFLIKIIFFWSS